MRARYVFALLACALSIVVLPPVAQGATTLPAGFQEQRLLAWGYATAVDFTADGRILMTTQIGEVRVIKNGQHLPTPAIDMADRICTDGERGLLGVAADPDFDQHHVYLFYTYKGTTTCGTDPNDQANTPVNRVSRFVLGDNDLIDPASEEVLIDNIPNMSGIHNGGDVQFGKDGNLYISTGDGGCDYAVPMRGCGPANPAARDKNVLAGKVLRITPEGDIPPGNPFFGANTARCNQTGKAASGTWCQEIYSLGLRNPFRLAFDPNAAGTRFFINDVGLDDWEEVDEGQAGANFGWNLREGPCVAYSSVDCGPPPAGITNPAYSYNHSTGCTAITGGAFVPNGAWPSQYDDSYLYMDLVCGKIVQLVPNGGGGYSPVDFATNLEAPIAMKFGPYGSGQALYYVSWSTIPGLYRISYSGGGNRSPNAVATANPVAGDIPLHVSFDAEESSDPDGQIPTYDWDFGDGTNHGNGVTASHTYGIAGTYTAKLTVSDGSGGTDTQSIRIDAGNNFPEPSITTPAAGDEFSVGQDITLSGGATDPEDGALPASALKWTVVKHHATHTHPFLSPTTGNGIHITAPSPEDFSATTNSYLEVILTATDSQGLTKTVTRELHPDLVNLTTATNPPGFGLELNGLPAVASATSWKGWQLNLNAPSPQQSGTAALYSFSSWSDGGAQSHVITTNADATYTATYVPSGYARPRSATPVRVALVPAFRPCTTPNRTHSPPLVYSSCAPPVQTSGYATLGTPSGTGSAADSVGYVALRAVLGNPSTPADEADVQLEGSITDVFRLGTSQDYTGALEAVTQLRLTDRLNGSSAADPGSVIDFPLKLLMPCTPVSGSVGSTCSAATTADALTPGLVAEGKRSLWQTGDVDVFDGGLDGNPATAGNTLFATQGVFVP